MNEYIKKLEKENEKLSKMVMEYESLVKKLRKTILSDIVDENIKECRNLTKEELNEMCERRTKEKLDEYKHALEVSKRIF